VFYDYGYGVVRDADLPSSPGADLDVVVEAYGLGMRLNFGDRLSGNLVFARPKSVWSQDGFFEPERADQVFFDLTYNVH
ncbi:MAG: hypothetical protein OEZ23_05865, partial [Gammaproteobacteria bacterium]|nr:hypothetical protein [Gammaproteobacteria bacterium]